MVTGFEIKSTERQDKEVNFSTCSLRYVKSLYVDWQSKCIKRGVGKGDVILLIC